MFDLLLRGGTVINATGALRADLAVTAGRVAALLAPEEPASAQSFDVTRQCRLGHR